MEYKTLFFFFQAEDGIRDGRVTGVQTCALPIFRRWRRQGGRCPPPSTRAWWDRRRGILLLPALGRPEWSAAASVRVPSRRARANLWAASAGSVVDLSGLAQGWAVLFGFALSARFVSAPVRLTCRYRCTGVSACATRTEYLHRRFLGRCCLLVRVRRGCCRRRSRHRCGG